MLTIFAIPKAFKGDNAVIQYNAINSWLQIVPKCEIFLMGDDEGIDTFADKHRVIHIPLIKKNIYGTPLINYAFDLIQKICNNEIIMYINSDIILLRDPNSILNHINFESYLISGRRHDININHKLNFSNDNWKKQMLHDIESKGILHSISGMDYFIFKKNTIRMPTFAVGRPNWDTWLIYDFLKRKLPVIDATEKFPIAHQNHDFSHSQFGENKRVGGPEWNSNIRSAGGFCNMLTLRNANYILSKNGLTGPSFPRCIHSHLALFYPYRLLLSIKRSVQKIKMKRA